MFVGLKFECIPTNPDWVKAGAHYIEEYDMATTTISSGRD